MFNSLDTRVVFFGGACNIAALEAVVRLVNAGFEVVACDHDPREGVILEDAGIPVIASRMEALTGANVVLSCCTHPEDVENLYLGDNGLLELAEPGTFLVDCSVTTPRLAQEIQAMAAVNDLNFLDAPLLNAGEGEQPVCFVGGDPKAVEMFAPLMPYLAPSVHPLDSPGEGMLSAVMVIIGIAGSLMGAIESMAMAHICGFTTKSALNALASTTAASRAVVEYVPQTLNYDFGGRVTVRQFMDLLDTALLTSEDMDVTLPMCETAFQLYDLLSVVGGDDMNIQALALLYEDEQTCADYGLDWALADRVREQQLTQMGYSQDFDDMEDGSGDVNLRELFNSIQTQMNAMGAMGTGDAGLDDYRNHHRREGGEEGHGFPPAGDFFSKN